MTQLIWYRNNLRVSDNQPLLEACTSEGSTIGVYCFDPRHFVETAFGFPKTGAFRAQFLLETIADLQKNLNSLNIPLLIFLKEPELVFPYLIEALDVNAVYSQTEWTSEEITATKAVKKAIPATVYWYEYYDQFLFHPEDIPFNDFNEIPKIFTNFRKKCEQYTHVRKCMPIPDKQEIVDRGLLEIGLKKMPTLKDLNLDTPRPDLRAAFSFKGGETAGEKRIQDYFWNTQNLATYKHTRNGLVGTAYSSKLSAWLANGSLSARSVFWEVKKFENDIVKNEDTYWMIFEMIWRDFFKYTSLKHRDALFKIGGILKKEYDWETSEAKTKQWIQGQTQYPFVNANMKELANTGWMSNRGRQNVASFWAKELQQDWRIGASYFESQLIDYDVHSNWGNWQYVSGVGNDPRDRKFNIERQAERYDPDGDFVSLWMKR